MEQWKKQLRKIPRDNRARIIYHDDGGEIIIKAIPRRDENTYSDF